MANTYTQIFIQLIFAVRGREYLITEKNRVNLEKYICGIVSNLKSKPLAIYCNPDHTHILIGLHPSTSISEIAKFIKSNSSKWINENKWMPGKFKWQEGYGAFSYSKSQVPSVYSYILNQHEHHKTSSFKEEYLKFLEKFEIEYDEKYLFDWHD